MLFCKNKIWCINGGVNLLALAFFLILAAPLFAQDAVIRATPSSADVYSNITVTRVLGLETLELENGEKVQLIGIDYPEIYMRQKQGQEAIDFLRRLVEGKKVRLEFDVERKDKGGRLLAYVYVLNLEWNDETQEYVNSEGGCVEEKGMRWCESSFAIFLNTEVIRQGYAEPMTGGANTRYAELFQMFHQDAMEKKRGWWKNGK